MVRSRLPAEHPFMAEAATLSAFIQDARKTALHGALGLLAGVLCAALIQLACGLYVWLEDQRQALALIALAAALPLGAACGGNARRQLARAVMAGFGLAMGTLAGASFFLPAASWFGAAALLGGALGGLSRRLALPASLAWCALCGLPFYYSRLEPWGLAGPAREAAALDTPWLGFAQHVLKEDPLHMSFIYFNQLTGLSSAAAIEPLDASRLWLWALGVMAAALFCGWRRA